MLKVVYTMSLEEQKALVAEIKAALKECPLVRKQMPTGPHFKYLCANLGELGWHSDLKGYRYQKEHPKTGLPFPAIPAGLLALTEKIKTLASEPTFTPESCLVNFYGIGDSVGLHQDKTEKNLKPMIISVSLGCSGNFLVKGRDPEKMVLESGQALVMSGDDRLCRHSMTGIIPGTGPSIGLKPDMRMNLTIRQVN